MKHRHTNTLNHQSDRETAIILGIFYHQRGRKIYSNITAVWGSSATWRTVIASVCVSGRVCVFACSVSIYTCVCQYAFIAKCMFVTHCKVVIKTHWITKKTETDVGFKLSANWTQMKKLFTLMTFKFSLVRRSTLILFYRTWKSCHFLSVASILQIHSCFHSLRFLNNVCV